jgi:hypothetical protein
LRLFSGFKQCDDNVRVVIGTGCGSTGKAGTIQVTPFLHRFVERAKGSGIDAWVQCEGFNLKNCHERHTNP